MADVIKINDNTWRFEDGGVRFFLLRGNEKAAIIDTGMNTPDAKKLAEGLTDLPIILINTHADPDHISGNGAFDELYMSPAEEDNYRHNGGKGMPVKPDLIGKLIEGAEQIQGGTASGKKVDMFGSDEMLYKFPYAGFLCDVQGK